MSQRIAHGVLHHVHTHKQLRDAVPAQSPEPPSQVLVEPPSFVRRAGSDSTCGPEQTAACTKYQDASNSGALTIGLAAAIPISVALIVLFFLHRRIKKKMRHEDANDKHKSLDFGLDHVNGAHKHGKPEMSVTTEGLYSSRRNRGMSMDMDLGNPYMLPAGLHGSRDSLRSMSKSMNDPNDPYRPVTFAHADNASQRSPSRLRNDNNSVYTGYSERSHDMHKASLLQNAAHMPHYDTPDMAASRMYSFDEPRESLSQPPPRKQSLAKGSKDKWYPADDPRYGPDSSPDLANANAQSPHDMLAGQAAVPNFPVRSQSIPRLNQGFEEHRNLASKDSGAMHPSGDALRITVPAPVHDRQHATRSPQPLPPLPQEGEMHSHQDHDQYPAADDDIPPPPPVPRHNSDPQNVHLDLPDQGDRRVSVMGMRPLPPDDPTDNPEQRANRIRSFYREYFDDSKPNPPGQYPVPVPAPYGDYGDDGEDDYYGGFLDDGAVYDPETGAFYYSEPQRPFAEPMARRAMTPPPRAPGHFMRGHRSVMSTQSAGRPPMMMMGKKKRALPPPKALQSLPTPHLLRDDTASMLDFAPPTTFREQRIGRAPDSPLGVQRPYSPAFRAHTPLGHSFDDMAVMPSPHALRKSGTFTALDFAPPPRFRERGDTMSDAGSIRSYRSNRSGISTVQRDAIRAGAYRLSRLPTDQVGTSQDLAQSLRPKWDLNR